MRANSLEWSIEPNVFFISNRGEVNIYAFEFSVFKCNNNNMDSPSCVSHWAKAFLTRGGGFCVAH